MQGPSGKSEGGLPEPGPSTWARVQGIVFGARQDVEGAARTLERMLAGLDPAGGPGPRLAHAYVLRGLSRLAVFFGPASADAVTPAREAVALLATLQDSLELRKARVGAYGDLSNALMRAGHHEEALAAARAGVALARECDDPMSVVRGLTRIGGQLSQMNRHEDSLRAHEEAVAFARSTRNPEAVGLALMGIGVYARDRGAIDQAVAILWSALRESAAAGVVGDQVAILQCLASPPIAGARPDAAREALRKLQALQARP